MGKASQLSAEAGHASPSSSLGSSWAFSGSVSESNGSYLDGARAYFVSAECAVVIIAFITTAPVARHFNDIVVVTEQIG